MRDSTQSTSYDRERFRKEYAYLVWSNPGVNDEVFMRQALMSGRFTAIFDACRVYGLTAVSEQWKLLGDERSADYFKVQRHVDRILSNLGHGYNKAGSRNG